MYLSVTISLYRRDDSSPSRSLHGQKRAGFCDEIFLKLEFFWGSRLMALILLVVFLRHVRIKKTPRRFYLTSIQLRPKIFDQVILHSRVLRVFFPLSIHTFWCFEEKQRTFYLVAKITRVENFLSTRWQHCSRKQRLSLRQTTKFSHIHVIFSCSSPRFSVFAFIITAMVRVNCIAGTCVRINMYNKHFLDIVRLRCCSQIVPPPQPSDELYTYSR